MASVLRQGKRYYCPFRFAGKRHSFPLGKVSRLEADRKTDQVDYLLMRLHQGLIQLPADIIGFLQRGGKSVECRHVPTAQPREVTLGALCRRYLELHQGSLEPITLTTVRIHLKHIETTLGKVWNWGVEMHLIAGRFPLQRFSRIS